MANPEGFGFLRPDPGGGDDLQGIKRGVIELADLIVVNKADGDLKTTAKRSAADYQHALRMLRSPTVGWTISSPAGARAAR